MLAALAVAATLASGCGPDYITQLPMLCDQVAEAPASIVFPVAADGGVSIEGLWRRWRPLGIVSESSCLEVQRRRDLVARVYRCEPQLRVNLHRRDRRAPTRVRITVGGSAA